MVNISTRSHDSEARQGGWRLGRGGREWPTYYRLMADIRHCDQCGRAFEPRREHARFCSAACRVAWNREHRQDPATELGALGWSVAALDDLAPRLAGLAAASQEQAAAVVSEAVVAGHDRRRHAGPLPHEAYDRSWPGSRGRTGR